MAAALAAAAVTVSAGTISASACLKGVSKDSKFLQDIGVTPNHWDACYAAFNWQESTTDLEAAWARVGVRCVTHPGDPNEYYIDGRQVERKSAFSQAMNKTGKYVSSSDYKLSTGTDPRY